MKKLTLAIILISLAGLTARAQSGQQLPRPLATKKDIRALEQDILKYMKLGNVPGLSAALIRDGKLVWFKGFGVTNTATGQPVTDQTIFEANSLSKPVFAVAVLTLVDQGKLSLDTPIIRYEGDHFNGCDDPRFKLVTTRMILSHSSGIAKSPADPQGKVHLDFSPGDKFSYSPTGIEILSEMIQKMTGMEIEDFIKQAVLGPLGMKASSYIWLAAYDSLRIYRHDWAGNADTGRYKWPHGAACCSLQTNPEDYARFVIAVMNGQLLKPATWHEMLKPQVSVDPHCPGLYWGLGWGLEKNADGETFWHWGDSGKSRNYVAADVTHKDGIVFFTNSENGLSFAREILVDAVGGAHPSLAFLGYRRYDSPSWKLLQAIVKKGAVRALSDYRKVQSNNEHVDEAQMNDIGYSLLNINKTIDAIEVFKQNTTDFPQSGDAWDSLAEAYMDNGDKPLAIRYYKRSLTLKPDNDNARQMLKKLGAGDQ